jgi:hypothetical protein
MMLRDRAVDNEALCNALMNNVSIAVTKLLLAIAVLLHRTCCAVDVVVTDSSVNQSSLRQNNTKAAEMHA